MKRFASLIVLVTVTLSTRAATVFDAPVTPEIIFGTGNANGNFVIDRSATEGVELGLRAKVRFDETNQPASIYNSDGAGTYTHEAGLPELGGFSFAQFSTSTAKWNFEFSVNSNYNGNGGALNTLTYLLSIDFDPAAGTEQFLAFDPINPASPGDFFDHATGTNATGNGAGTSAGSEAIYLANIASHNVAQNSWNPEFFDNATYTFDGRDLGEYVITLAAFDGANKVAETSMTVVTVPEPSSAALLLLGVAGLLLRRRCA